MTRRLRHALCFCASALAITAGGATAAAEGGSSGPRATEPAGPPTAAALRQSTREFLSEQPRQSVRAGGSGGLGPAPEEIAEVEGSLAVALYGAPQLGQTVIGRNSPAGAGRKLERQAGAYEKPSQLPVVGALDLVTVIATADRGTDGKYRFRQRPDVISTYLEAARAVGARLMLDIQPGRSSFVREVKALREWIAEPDVDVALDPEWNVGRRGVPGRTTGKVKAKEVNRVAAKLRRMVAANDLPSKLLVVHQFHRGSVRKRSQLRDRKGVGVVLNFDGIGSPAAKQAGYAALSKPRITNGFSLFYRLDAPLMKPSAVLALEPQPGFLLYQ